MNDEEDPDRWWPKREDWPEFPPYVWPEEALAKHPHPERLKPTRFQTEQALALLILDDVVVLVNGGENGISPQVGCNDVFYWACADCEPIPPVGFGGDLDEPFWSLYDQYRKDGHTGALIWCCLRRGMRPQTPIERDMRAAGTWTDELEALPPREPGSCG